MKEWAEEARRNLSGLNIYTENADVYPLLDVHMHLLCGEEKEAAAILEDYNYARSLLGKESLVAIYYQYLLAKLKKSGSHVNRAVEEINKWVTGGMVRRLVRVGGGGFRAERCPDCGKG